MRIAFDYSIKNDTTYTNFELRTISLNVPADCGT